MTFIGTKNAKEHEAMLKMEGSNRCSFIKLNFSAPLTQWKWQNPFKEQQ
jgi:hypothetical protein